MSASSPQLDLLFSGTPDRMPKLSGRDLRDSGLKSVFRHTPQWYRDAFESAVIGFARGRQFTIEDVREIAGDPPDSVSSNCMGSLMTAVAKKKLAKKTGQYVKAKRSGMHATDLACWERL